MFRVDPLLVLRFLPVVCTYSCRMLYGSGEAQYYTFCGSIVACYPSDNMLYQLQCDLGLFLKGIYPIYQGF
ncbi:hypothetical protein OPV22_001904 [Ensete ventricosum]|uniref:Secreted protein n=1 Tax=Ensete ventricosum TaxID=4639 RepID=A0AAV8RS42_ENSVE|nr:hypothetical protein OPV22_001904 [Ensete ventricosum]